jgi:arabinofuranosyltransferase
MSRHEGGCLAVLDAKLEPFDSRSGSGWPDAVLLAAVLGVVGLAGLYAWVSDDAYITFRTIFNFTSGYGLRYNIVERVQAYTHPLWMLLSAVLYRFTREVFFTSIGLGLALTLLTGLVWGFRVCRGRVFALVGLVGISLSMGFIDYSTSGLENSLTHVLLLLFARILLEGTPSPKRLLGLAVVAGLATLNRMDTVLLVGPGLAWAWWRCRSWSATGIVLVGLVPFFAWEAFAWIYYGFPFPNTAYAKLNTGIPRPVLYLQGIRYLETSLRWSPVTLITILLGLLGASFKRQGALVAMAAGIAAYLSYVVWVGGDFMAERFLTGALLLAFAILSRVFERPGSALALGLALLAIGLTGPKCPWYVTEKRLTLHSGVDHHGIVDERQFYVEWTGLYSFLRSGPVNLAVRNETELRKNTERLRERFVLRQGFLGMPGYRVGPAAHIIDKFALADPLLARLPAAYDPEWRVGHFVRQVPPGYERTLHNVDGPNLIEDRRLAEYYDQLSVVVREPVGSWQRMLTVFRFALGRYDSLIDRTRYRQPATPWVWAETFGRRVPEGIPPDDPRLWTDFGPEVPLGVRFAAPVHVQRLELSLDAGHDYSIGFYHGWQKAGDLVVHAPSISYGAQHRVVVALPREITESGFDWVRILPLSGEGPFAAGHLVLLE